MYEERDISPAVIARLPRYHRYLGELMSEGVERISSKDLSRIMKTTASQIRQDLNHFGGFGQQGYGYNIKTLHHEIGKILGLDKDLNMILIGAGNLGQAIVNYMHFRRRGFYFKGAFDIDPSLHGTWVDESVQIYPMEKLPAFVRENKIDIAVLTVPKKAAIETAVGLFDTGIRGIWNFAHVDIEAPPHIQVENVHLYDSIMKLSYSLRMNERDRHGSKT